MKPQPPKTRYCARLSGRGTRSNDAGRFERYDRQPVVDDWPGDDDLPAPLRTEVSIERPRSAISYNRSPDLPFDRSINPYRGCEHGCIYCFARPGHAWLGMSPGLDFETRLIARPEIADILAQELAKKNYQPATLAIGTFTDPYQPIEKEHKVMRRVLAVLAEYRHPVAIITKGTLIERDIDILADLAQSDLVHVGISVTTLDAALARKMEPRVPSPKRRLQIIRRLSDEKIPVRVMASPLVPGLSDHELEQILSAAKDNGAAAASWIMLRLPREVSPLFQEWLTRCYPERHQRVMSLLREMHGGKDYDPAWQKRMRGTGSYADLIARRFNVAIGRLGLAKMLPALRTDLFRPPSGSQLSLF